MTENDNLSKIRHSLAHLLAAAVIELYPDALNTIGPAIDNGFYYDFDFETPITEADLKKIEKKMREIFPTWKNFAHKEVSADEARTLFTDNPYKLELIDELEGKGEKITLYTSGNFTDLCRGGHVDNMNEIDPKAFKLSHLAGAYWRGHEKNKMLTRIYGLAFNTKEELDNYLTIQEEAKKRDHKKIGKELDLFTFSELVGSGLPLWTPKGTILRDILDERVWQLRKKYGYERVDIPHITKKDLYEKSGHWEKFQNELFKITTREKHLFVMKPMNCPHHIQIFDRKKWSYRDLPQRYASTTKVYRDEQSGELAGLSRVRSITQDDAHVFCRQADIKKEMGNVWNIVEEFYGLFGFKLEPRLSLHDPKQMDKYMGDLEVWENTANELRQLVKEKGVTAKEAIGEAAFYGPKIDFISKDSLGREWQVATIQLDANMPKNFDLTCTNEKSQEEPVIMIHAAIMGSIERFLSVYIEDCGGAFPFWLSPVQAKVLPIGQDHQKYAEETTQKLKEAGIRTELEDSNVSLGKKIRQGKLEKVPYLLVVGDKEMKSQTVALEGRDKGNLGEFPIDKLVENFQKENTPAP